MATTIWPFGRDFSGLNFFTRGLIFAVNMLVNTEAGDTYNFKQMSQWLKQAGFKNPRLLNVPSVSPLILADKPG